MAEKISVSPEVSPSIALLNSWSWATGFSYRHWQLPCRLLPKASSYIAARVSPNSRDADGSRSPKASVMTSDLRNPWRRERSEIRCAYGMPEELCWQSGR
ncbi:hypothetical protein [Mycobacterium attenuatum]|uniref:hypothetical protein n=1 Tax=Mycobacterium attenuatum TaxID=2341086 RepID=UPI0010A9786C|nr:hypothetical protein [Mycobacterium attenuatum]